MCGDDHEWGPGRKSGHKNRQSSERDHSKSPGKTRNKARRQSEDEDDINRDDNAWGVGAEEAIELEALMAKHKKIHEEKESKKKMKKKENVEEEAFSELEIKGLLRKYEIMVDEP